MSDSKKTKQMTITESLASAKELETTSAASLDTDMPDDLGVDLQSHTTDIDV